MTEAPVIDMSKCSGCGTCVELCPTVFRVNKDTGAFEARDLSEYPEDEVMKAISYCPKDCITWEGGG